MIALQEGGANYWCRDPESGLRCAVGQVPLGDAACGGGEILAQKLPVVRASSGVLLSVMTFIRLLGCCQHYSKLPPARG